MLAVEPDARPAPTRADSSIASTFLGKKATGLYSLVVVVVLAASLFVGATCSLFNKAPSVPVVSGPTTGGIGVAVSFTATATDPEGDSVAFQFDWGDSNTLTWTAFVANGETTTTSHTYSDSGTFAVKARTKDKKGRESGWSGGQTLSISDKNFPDRVVAAIPVGTEGLSDMAASPSGEFVYVGHRYEDRVSVIDTRRNEVVDSIPMDGVYPGDITIAVLPSGEYAYATCYQDDWLAVIRASDNTVVDSVPGFREPRAITVLPDGRYVYVAAQWNRGGDSGCVKVVRTSDNVVTATIGCEDEYDDLSCLAALPNGDYVYVGSWGSQVVYVIRTCDNTIVDTIALHVEVGGVAPSPDGKNLYVVGRDKVLVVRTSDNVVVDSVSVGREAWSVAVLPSGDYVYVTGPDSAVSVVRASDLAVVHTVKALPDEYPGSLAILPGGDRVYVGGDRSTVYVIGF